jgi:predicted component of type VI protein secretion system
LLVDLARSPSWEARHGALIDLRERAHAACQQADALLQRRVGHASPAEASSRAARDLHLHHAELSFMIYQDARAPLQKFRPRNVKYFTHAKSQMESSFSEWNPSRPVTYFQFALRAVLVI